MKRPVDICVFWSKLFVPDREEVLALAGPSENWTGVRLPWHSGYYTIGRKYHTISQELIERGLPGVWGGSHLLWARC